MEHLLALQTLLLQDGALSPEQEAEARKLRAKVPQPIQEHFDRLVARGKKGVAVVRNGVCSECHLRISIGTQARLPVENEIFLCENCGRYLYLPPEEAPGKAIPVPPVSTPAKRVRKKTPPKA